MIRTIKQGSFILIQGTFVRQHADGRITVRVGDKLYVGAPIDRADREAA
ncbi:hypothetical protein [Phaeobacter sp.]|nr:hypothetical protein [Phaeobacter sp.]